MTDHKPHAVASNALFGADDELLQQAHEVVWAMKQASTSVIQRRLRIGYLRASYIIDELERRGVVGPFRKDAPREVLLPPNVKVEAPK